jgi:hypothetical protein
MHSDASLTRGVVHFGVGPRWSIQDVGIGRDHQGVHDVMGIIPKLRVTPIGPTNPVVFGGPIPRTM